MASSVYSSFFVSLNLQQRNEMIAHLKDQLQEMKAKTSMEGKYIKKDAEVSISSAASDVVLVDISFPRIGFQSVRLQILG